MSADDTCVLFVCLLVCLLFFFYCVFGCFVSTADVNGNVGCQLAMSDRVRRRGSRGLGFMVRFKFGFGFGLVPVLCFTIASRWLTRNTQMCVCVRAYVSTYP